MIPEEAVVVAARAIAKADGSWVLGEWEDSDVAEKLRDEVRRIALAALEAAAPHMLADAWDAGHRDSGREFEQAYDIVTPDEERFIARNPYKPTP